MRYFHLPLFLDSKVETLAQVAPKGRFMMLILNRDFVILQSAPADPQNVRSLVKTKPILYQCNYVAFLSVAPKGRFSFAR